MFALFLLAALPVAAILVATISWPRPGNPNTSWRSATAPSSACTTSTAA